MRMAVGAGLAGPRFDRASQQAAGHRLANPLRIRPFLPPSHPHLTRRMAGHDASHWAMSRRIGLLGGSFNPAHRAHRRISLAAMDALGLDEVWWLVSPGNPLKARRRDMAPYEARLASARLHGAPKPDQGQRFRGAGGTRYTVDTLAALRPPLAAPPVHLADGRGYCGPIPSVEALARLGAHGADCGRFAARL